LFAAGIRRFGVVTGPIDAPVSNLRSASFLERLAELGVENVQTYVGDYHYESGQAAAMQLLSQPGEPNPRSRPEVIFCVNDAMALGVLDTARFTLMLRVPSDVSVVGFDDIPTGQRPAYLLSTVRQPFEEMTQAATLLLRQSLDEVAIPNTQILLPGTLIERGSAQLLPVPISA
jgi:DNA-binding LacI/PurR family transcriptional regulator